MPGAIADFEFFLSRVAPDAPAGAERAAWIEALRAGHDPFTPEALEGLRR